MLTRLERARQFLPFDALKGLQEAIKEKEICYIDKKELSEELQEELDIKLSQIEKGDKIYLKYYKNRQYIEKIGIVKEISQVKKKIILQDDVKISVSDILEIDIQY